MKIQKIFYTIDRGTGTTKYYLDYLEAHAAIDFHIRTDQMGTLSIEDAYAIFYEGKYFLLKEIAVK